MTARRNFLNKKRIFCRFEGECEFKKTIAKKNMSEPETRYAICTWKGHCNQQADRLRKCIIEAHGEGISAEGMVGKGTTFTAKLPIAPEMKESAKILPSPPETKTTKE